MSEPIIRTESPDDVGAICEVNIAAFRDHAVSNQTEHLIVDALRAAGALSASLVAVDGERVVGHIAFSDASVGDLRGRWLLLGPVAVLPERQGCGIGSALVEAGLEALRRVGAAGVVLVGDPAFYERFGFEPRPGLTYEGVPDQYVLGLPFSLEAPRGQIHAHPAFEIDRPNPPHDEGTDA